MTANIDISTGTPAIAFNGETPWHGLGQHLEVGATIDEWTVAAGLDWVAKSAPVKFQANGQLQELANKRVLYRSDVGNPLGLVSDQYQVVQPRQIMEFFRELVEHDFPEFEMNTAGALDGGKRVWALARGAKSVEIPLSPKQRDIVERYLLLTTSFDGTSATRVIQTSVRVVCQNTLHAAFGNKQQEIVVRHSTTFDAQRIKQQAMLDEQWEVFAGLLERLAAKKITAKDAQHLFFEVYYPENIRKAKWFSQKSADRQVEKMMAILDTAPGQGTLAAKKSLYGVVNAVTFFEDHVAKSRDQERRLNKAWFGKGAERKTAVMQLAAQMA